VIDGWIIQQGIWSSYDGGHTNLINLIGPVDREETEKRRKVVGLIVPRGTFRNGRKSNDF
jgi:hypothetical protein